MPRSVFFYNALFPPLLVFRFLVIKKINARTEYFEKMCGLYISGFRISKHCHFLTRHVFELSNFAIHQLLVLGFVKERKMSALRLDALPNHAPPW